MKNRFRKQNFSLLEMLVVIAIIAVLALMLMPGLNSAKEIAKRNQCLSRVRAISQLANTYSTQNDGLVPMHAYYVPPGEQYCTYDDFSTRIMKGLLPEAAGGRNSHWWMFICTNVLPYWNAGATMNAGGYKKGGSNSVIEKAWQRIKPGSQGDTDDIGMIYEVYAFGNFGHNKNGHFGTRMYTDKHGSPRAGEILHYSQIKSPEKRAYISEEGESANKDNGSHLMEFVAYDDPVSRGKDSKGTATGYIPGMGGGGVGREKMESIGFDETISETQLDEERLELVKRDVMEGRHAGATLHGFFDGHAEVLSAETVGNLQLGPGDTREDLRGPYGTITDAADDDEK